MDYWCAVILVNDYIFLMNLRVILKLYILL